MTHPLAGQRPDPSTLCTASGLGERYLHPELPLKPIKNGTSGHRGATGSAFSELHVAAMAQALVDIRRERGSLGPLPAGMERFEPGIQAPGPIVIGKDVRFTSDLAEQTAIEVFTGNGIPVIIHAGGRSTPTPVVSHTIRAANALGQNVEGVIITASHNPPEDAGFKSNGLDGGPNTRTKQVDEIANRYLEHPQGIQRIDLARARSRGLLLERDLVEPYVDDLASVIDFDRLKGMRFGASPLGGSAHGYYEAISARYGVDIQVVLGEPDPASAFRTYDWDGRLRGDPSSPWAMKAVQGHRERLGVPFLGANDNDADRFGGEDATGILNPNHALCVLFDHLCRTRGWSSDREIGRTIGTTHMLDRIAASWGRGVHEVDVGFKWYVEGLARGRYVLAGEESAGCSFPRKDGSLWVAEKDGIATVLLIMELIACSGKDVGTLYRELEAQHGAHLYERVDMPADSTKKARLASLGANPAQVSELLSGRRFAGLRVERIVAGDGVKVVLEGGVWILKRASGTEDIIKDYREERGESLDRARLASRELDRVLGLDD